MTKQEALARLRAHEADLRGMGIERLSIFGSTARGEAREDSDLDLAVQFRNGLKFSWGWYWMEHEIAAMLGVPVDMVSEPTDAPRLQAQIDRDRVHVF